MVMPSQTFAEYENSAPELVTQVPISQSKPTGSSNLKGGLEPYSGYANPSVGKVHKRRVLGVAPWMAFAFISIALVIVVGVVVGAVLGTKHKSHTTTAPATLSQIPSSTRSQVPSSTESTIVTATPTGLTIIEAIYATQNVTKNLQSVQNGPNIVLNMSATDSWSKDDPWVGVKKCLALLYSYGPSIRTYVACESDGSFTLGPQLNSSSFTHEHEITRLGPSNSDFAIVSVVWGGSEIRDKNVYQTLYDLKSNGTQVLFGNDVFGSDTLVGLSKSGVIWYTEDDFLTFKNITGKETETGRFE